MVESIDVTLHTRRTNAGYKKTCYSVPVGQKMKTPWLDLRAKSKYALIVHDGDKSSNIHGRVAPLDWYAPPWKGLKPNAWRYRVTCG